MARQKNATPFSSKSGHTGVGKNGKKNKLAVSRFASVFIFLTSAGWLAVRGEKKNATGGGRLDVGDKSSLCSALLSCRGGATPRRGKVRGPRDRTVIVRPWGALPSSHARSAYAGRERGPRARGEGHGRRFLSATSLAKRAFRRCAYPYHASAPGQSRVIADRNSGHGTVPAGGAQHRTPKYRKRRHCTRKYNPSIVGMQPVVQKEGEENSSSLVNTVRQDGHFAEGR